MNIFGVGGAEIVVIFLIMLVVAGPQRMIRWAYVLGLYVGKLRQMWAEVVDVLQDEVNEAGINVTIPKELPTRQNISKIVSDMAKPYTAELEESLQKVKQPLQESVAEAEKVVKDARQDAAPASRPDKSGVATQLGSWNQTPGEDTSDKGQTDEQLNLGAWSMPQSPGERAGDSVDR